MGIKGLTKFLADHAPSALRTEARASLLGRVVAVDASMALYQFLSVIRDQNSFGNLTDEAGNVTSHLAGMLSRVTRMLEQGIRPVYVFDGEAPEQKQSELEKRRERREEALLLAETAKETGDDLEFRKQIGRTIKVTPQQNEEVQQLLQLLGLPVVLAPGEAEAQCAALAREGRVWAAATEDADALTFGTPILVRNLTFSETSSSNTNNNSNNNNSNNSSNSSAKSHPVLSIHLEKVLSELKLDMNQFIDFCILCGCDYCPTIKGVGAKTAYNLIKENGDIEGALKALRGQGGDKGDRFIIPDPFPFEAARELFKNPKVKNPKEVVLKWGEVDENGLKKFLVEERTFNEARVNGFLQRLRRARGLFNQTRLEAFFGCAVSKPSDLKLKQKEETEANNKKGGDRKTGSGPLKAKRKITDAKGPPAKRR